MSPSMPASSPAPATLLWNSSAELPPEDDRIEALLRLQQRPQGLVHVGVERFVARRIEAVERDVRHGALERRGRGIDARHMGSAAGERCDAEAAGVAIAVEDPRQAEVAHRVGEELTVVALVEVKARLVSTGDVEAEPPSVLVDRQRGRSG